MKKLLTILLLVAATFALAACGGNGISPKTDSASTGENANSAPVEAEDEDSEGARTSGQGEKILVAYFSATGSTEGVAKTIARALNADLHEIIPAQPYSDKDLNYNDSLSRSTLEQNDESARPEISSSVEDIDDYDVIVLGYPIWWSEEPRIMDTFMESYDFSGKTIVPFCTSGGSGIGASASNLESLTTGATWLDGQRFDSAVSEDDVLSWAAGIGLAG